MGDRPLLDGPVVIRPGSPGRGRSRTCRARAGCARRRRSAKTTPPDLDKVGRALMDALTGVVYRDDAQVIRLDAGKSYGDPGVAITIEEAIP
jgi:crossover junction endodeoxyribonuclease RusA